MLPFDTVRFKSCWGGNLLRRLLVTPSFQVTFWYRIARYLMLRHSLMYWSVSLIYRHYGHKYGIGLPVDLQVGEGLRFAHFSCIFIGAEKVGKNLTMYQECTIGAVHGKGAPIVVMMCLCMRGQRLLARYMSATM